MSIDGLGRGSSAMTFQLLVRDREYRPLSLTHVSTYFGNSINLVAMSLFDERPVMNWMVEIRISL